MASKWAFGVVLFLVLFSTQAEGNNNNFNLVMASRTLSDKGYHAMSMIFQVFLNDLNISQLLSGNSTLTVFAPRDDAFFSSKYAQPPLTLLQYHVVPWKLEGEALESLLHGSKIDTLLLGHPLVVTTLPTDEYASLNGVRVTERNLYNDGGLIVHGVDNFFDPAFQTLIYPWYDVKKDIHTESSNRFSWVIKGFTENLFLLLSFMVFGLISVVVSLTTSCCIEYTRSSHRDDDYVPLQHTGC